MNLSMKPITTANSEIHFKSTAYETLNSYLSHNKQARIFVLVDENTRKVCLPVLAAALAKSFNYEIIEIIAGEAHKNIETCNKVWERLSKLGADRKSILINLGGGVITDLGGFVASTFKRGIQFINIPTTLLSMVDASIGGKTGVDMGILKNQIGVIREPIMVLVDTTYLQTLEKRQYISGFAEMLKHGLIRDAMYWSELKNMLVLDIEDSHIYKSIIIKQEVVLQDPSEQGIRKILNFGHTMGHAIESYYLEHHNHKALLHGEAIAAGMVLEAYLSHKLCGLPKEEMNEIKNTFSAIYDLVTFFEEDITGVLSLLKFDKKNHAGQINFSLLKAIGMAVIDINIPDNLYTEAFAYYKE